MSEFPNLTRDEIVRRSLDISNEYARQGLKLTIRQLYYQFVARAFLGSGQKSYKRIVGALTEARLNGDFPLDRIEDRGRDVIDGEFTRADHDVGLAQGWAAERIRELPDELIGFDRWYGQPTHVSVWVEKEALSGVFEGPCRQLGVSMFACRGYPSVSALNAWVESVSEACSGLGDVETKTYHGIRQTFRQFHRGIAKRCVILYFGDHDPDGFEIPRSAVRNLRRLMKTSQIDFPLRLERIGLNMDQIRKYNPPPFEAKITSSRFASYLEEHRTHDAWELDALDPAVLRDLIRSNVQKHWNQEIHDRNVAHANRARADLRERMLEDDWLARAMDDDIPARREVLDHEEHELDFDFDDGTGLDDEGEEDEDVDRIDALYKSGQTEEE